jgi:hypothetical protein
MKKVIEESKGGLYDIYYTEDGTRLIVLSGLNAEDTYTPPILQKQIHEHYALISSLYWVIFGVSLTYMIGVHVVIPLLKRYNLY